MLTGEQLIHPLPPDDANRCGVEISEEKPDIIYRFHNKKNSSYTMTKKTVTAQNLQKSLVSSFSQLNISEGNDSKNADAAV